MNIAFYTEHLSLRGTEIALFDYAYFNKLMFNNNSFIIINGNLPESKNLTRKKFENEFGNIYPLKNVNDIESFIDNNKIDLFYKICAGTPEPIPHNCKTAIHVVFPTFTPFGNSYFYVSEWLRNYSVPQDKQTQYDFIPHIVSLPPIDENLRTKYNIKQTDIVLGYHGGSDSFDIPFVKNSMKKLLNTRNDVFFMFMNIPTFYSHKNIIYLPGTFDLYEKTKFINTCDYMIHARSRGETFGLSIAEFSIKNKKIITYEHPTEKNHLMVLKDKCITYDNEQTLDNIFKNIHKEVGENCYTEYTPEIVMKKFKTLLLDTI